MKFKVHCELEYNVRFPSTFILDIHALRTPHQNIIEESFIVTPHLQAEEFTSPHSETRFTLLDVKKKGIVNIVYDALVENKCRVIDMQKQSIVSVGKMNGEVIPFLFPSRYCQSDKLFRLANNKFGKLKTAFAKVLAVTNWIHNNVEYLSGSSNSQTSAFDTVTERAGVCRDFAHLGIALCRALSIPARYFTCYAYRLNPPDFHACFEAFIENEWIVFDATKLAPLNGLVKIASGRDAADVAIASTFGYVLSNTMIASCELVKGDFKPVFYGPHEMKGIAY